MGCCHTASVEGTGGTFQTGPEHPWDEAEAQPSSWERKGPPQASLLRHGPRLPPRPGLAPARARAGRCVCGLAEALRGHGQKLSWTVSPSGTEARAGLGTTEVDSRGKPGPRPPRAERPRPGTPPSPELALGPCE